jgi:hypothetical protein
MMMMMMRSSAPRPIYISISFLGAGFGVSRPYPLKGQIKPWRFAMTGNSHI